MASLLALTGPPGVDDQQHPVGSRNELYRWQFDALVAWLGCGRQGVVEAVTGSGKTDLALAAIADALRRGRFVLVLVPSRVLMEQWYARLVTGLPGVAVGRLGDNSRDRPDTCEVLIATRHSAATHRPKPPGEAGGLLVVDECHGLGGAVLRRALLTEYQERLGLTATLERSDDAVADLLLPFFGGTCYRYGFEQAIAEGVCAQPRVAFVGVSLTFEEREEYIATEAQLVGARRHLRSVQGVPLEPFGAFLAAVGHLAEHDAGADGRAARDYLDAFAKRRLIVARSSGKYELLGRFAPVIADAEGALLFTETVRAANHAINRLDPLVNIELITGSTARRDRRMILDDLRSGSLDIVAAPRVLDEGIDVPDANLGIVMSASRTRRQMVQRMGRILRRKRPGVSARFVIMFARDTIEDPRTRFERDGFLDEIERVAVASGVFDGDQFEDLEAFLVQPGPAVIPEPKRLASLHAAFQISLRQWWDADPATGRIDVESPKYPGGVSSGLPQDGLDARVAALVQTLGAESVYAYASFGRPSVPGPAQPWQQAAWRLLEACLPQPWPDNPGYLPMELDELPEVAQPKVIPKRLSSGQAPLEIAQSPSGWQMRCTGCGEGSATVRFRWQVLDETVTCRCA
ncbi:MAG: DEAD/DEAH box helicase [Acidimicrobiales bacterium]